MDHAADRPDAVDLLVAQIAADVGELPHVRVTCDDRRRRDLQHLHNRVPRQLGHVDHASESVDPLDGGDAEPGQTAVFGCFVRSGRRIEDGPRRVGEVVVAHVSEREHPRPGFVEVVERRDVLAEDHRVLEAEDERRLALFVGGDDLVGRPGHHRVVRRVRGQGMHGRYLLVRPRAGRGVAFGRARAGPDGDRHDDRVDAAGVELGRRDLRQPVVAHVGRRRFRQLGVGVGIEDEYPLVDGASLLEQVLRRPVGLRTALARGAGRASERESRDERDDRECCSVHRSSPSVHGATRTIRVPTLPPASRSTNASGAFSRPSKTSCLGTSSPASTHSRIRVQASG